jgi:predicted PurR-regulated permease PerM
MPIRSDQAQMLLWAAVGLVLLWGLYLLGPVLTPFLAGAMLAYILKPGVEWLVRHKCPRGVASALMIVLTLLLAVLLVLILVPLFTRQLNELSLKVPAVLSRLNEQLAPKIQEWFGVTLQLDAQSIKQFLSDHWQSAEGVIPKILSSLKLGGLALAGVLGTLVLIPLVLFYLLLEWDSMIRRIDHFVPRRYSNQVRAIARDIDLVLAEFLRGQLSVMGLLALYYAIGLWLGGLDFALPIGIITGLLVFVPYLGFATGLAMAVMVALLQFDNATGMIVIAVVFGFGQVLEGFFLTPKLVGNRIGLHPLAVIFALLAFGQVFGFFGVLLALPASAVLLVALRRVNAAYLASSFYQSRK